MYSRVEVGTVNMCAFTVGKLSGFLVHHHRSLCLHSLISNDLDVCLYVLADDTQVRKRRDVTSLPPLREQVLDLSDTYWVSQLGDHVPDLARLDHLLTTIPIHWITHGRTSQSHLHVVQSTHSLRIASSWRPAA